MKYTAFASLTLLALSACTSETVRDTLGLERSSPDEFRVVSRPPLSVPPQFALRPPSNADASPNQLPADKKAQSLMNGQDTTADANGSLKADTAVMPVTISNSRHGLSSATSSDKPATGAEAQFLKNAGADAADPNVRNTLVEEKYAVQEKKEDKSWWNFWSSDDKKDPIVDSKKEADRIKQDEDAGKPVTTGDTPNVKPSDQGLLDSIIH